MNKRTLFKILLTAILLVFTVLLIVSRGHPFRYFSTRCINYRQKVYSRQLNDRVVDYSAAAKLRGVSPISTDRELRKKIEDRDLVKVRSNRFYIVDKLRFSQAVVTPESKALIEEIGRRFREKTSGNGLAGARFYITSLTREKANLKMLSRFNSNTSRNSPHLYGNAFDISYKRFSARKMILTNCDIGFMKEALAEVISQLRDEKKCWATYERNQNCFHVVSR